MEKTVVTATRIETLIGNLQASVTVITKGGTFNSYIGNARLNAATDRFGLRVAAGHKRTGG